MENYKKIILGFGCRNGQAVFAKDGYTYQGGDILPLCRHYSDNGGDEVFLYDASETEEDHDRTIGMIKEAVREIDSPLITGGRVKRLEDVKKYLYAGAKAVFLDVSIEENVDLMKEAADRFGSEKIYAYLPGASYLSSVKEYAQLGASTMILHLKNKSLIPDSEEFQLLEKASSSFLICWNGEEEESLEAILKLPMVEGVILSLPEGKDENAMKLKQRLQDSGVSMNTFQSSIAWKDFKLGSDGLIPVIVQDYRTLEVLMMAYMNEEAFHHTLRTGRMTYFSRSRQSLWLKGETSGHFQYVKSLKMDCDNDTILAKVHQVGSACHTGSRSCFFQTLAEKEYRDKNPLKVFQDVYHIIQDRKVNPKEGSYTNYLFEKGIDKILKKVGEEAAEIIISAKNPNPEEVKYEISDFLYHMMVLMAEKGLKWEDITEELANR